MIWTCRGTDSSGDTRFTQLHRSFKMDTYYVLYNVCCPFSWTLTCWACTTPPSRCPPPSLSDRFWSAISLHSNQQKWVNDKPPGFQWTLVNLDVSYFCDTFGVNEARKYKAVFSPQCSSVNTANAQLVTWKSGVTGCNKFFSSSGLGTILQHILFICLFIFSNCTEPDFEGG